MKRIMNVYESVRVAIRISFLGFVLIAFGFLIQNESVNIFYTFRNVFILMLAEGCLQLGRAIIINLPLIFMLNIVCKRANSAYPVCLGIVGYFAFLISTSLFAPTTLGSTAYSTGLGINSIFNMTGNSVRYPLELGLITSFLVGYIVRFCFIRSRHRSTLSILGFLNKDTAGLIYTIVLCTLCVIGASYVWPIAYTYIQKLITYIAADIHDPIRIGLYGVMDRTLSMFSLGNIIRQPFWYTSLGGSLQTISGTSIIGDVNIWAYAKEIVVNYEGAGRFVTPYYVINIFMIPFSILGTFLSINEKGARKKLLFGLAGTAFISIVCGNPLPFELLTLFTAPLLLVLYLIVVFVIFYALSYFGIYLGSNIVSNSTVTAMPGNLPDLIINLRDINHSETLFKIVLAGLIAGIVCLIVTMIYYRFLAYDLTKSGATEEFALDIISAVGGRDNIEMCGAGMYRICIHLKDLEQVNIEEIQDLRIKRVSETNYGIDIECGTSAYIISRKINKLIQL